MPWAPEQLRRLVPAKAMVATNSSGVLPNNIIVKAPDAEMVDGSEAAAFAPVAHDHDDRYYAKGQTQARTAPNSLNCVPGQYLRSVAADGTPTCVDALTTSEGIAGPIGPKAPSEAGNWQFAGPMARVTTTDGDTVSPPVSGVIGTTVSSARWTSIICRAVPDGVLTSLPVTQYMTTHLVVNEQEVISATFPSPHPVSRDLRLRALCPVQCRSDVPTIGPTARSPSSKAHEPDPR